MKKFLLAAVLLTSCVVAANAETIVDVEQDYSSMTEFPFYVIDYKPEIKNGNLVVTNTEAKDFWANQYFLCYDFPVKTSVEYTVSAKIKSDVAGDITVVMGNWGDTKSSKMAVKGDNEWAEYSTTIADVPLNQGKSFLIFQSGNMVGTYEIEWVKVTHNDDEIVIPTPDEGTVIASYFDGNGKTFGGWGATSMEVVEEDGKPCLKVVNDEAKDEWAAQFAIDYEFIPETTYYLNFDVKGTPFNGIPSGFQGERDYASAGNMNKFNVTDNWTNVTIYGKALNAGTESHPNMPVRWLASVGKYVGTMYITNVRLYTDKKTAVENVGMPENDGHIVVFNLLGIKVLDTTDPSMLGSLPKGIYIVNGKKVAVGIR